MHKNIKQILLIIFLLFVLIGNVFGEELYGIYQEDEQEIVAGTFTGSDVTHLRDNYYGVVYLDGSSLGKLQIIEVDENYNVINTSVDTYTFSGASRDLTIINYNESTGLSLIGYVTTASDYINYKTFDLYNNGTIRALDTETQFVEDFSKFQIIKTGEFTFLGLSEVVNGYGGETYFYTYGGTMTAAGAMTIYSDSNSYYDLNSAVYASEVNLVKDDSTCFLYYKWSNTGYTTSIGCSVYSFSGGGGSRHAASALSKTQFESNEINYIDVDVDTDDGFIYAVYGETIDKYPVLMVRDSSSNALLDKLRINTDTITSISVKSLGSNNVLVVYSNATNIVYKTFSISVAGLITEGYTEPDFSVGSSASISEIYNSSNRYLSSYTGGSGDILVLGVGLIPAPGPDETSLTIKDERTLGNLDFTDLELTFEAHCVGNQNYQESINSTTTDIPVDCEYESFAIKVEFLDSDNISYNYRRYYLRDLTDTYNQFDLNVYLINPYDTDFVYNEVIIDDLKNQYINAQVFFNKNINGVDTQITAYDLDIQNSMMAILMNGESYEVYVDADGISKEYLGTYISPRAIITSESTVFHLYDVILKADFTKIINMIDYQIYTENNQIEYNIRTAEQVDSNLINATFFLYEGTSELGSLIYNESVGSSTYSITSLYGFLSGGSFNYTSYENKTVYGKLVIFFVDDGEIRQVVFETPLWVYNKLTLPLAEYVNQSFLDWFIILILSVIALYATIESANMASLGIIGIAALFVMFGWFSIGSGALALAAFISLISMIAKKNKEVY